MVEIRVHGRGGQGVVTAADLMAYAAFADGHHAQAFPSFGSERTGAPVVSYCRIEDREIRSREPILQPDVVIVQDPTLLAIMNPFSGLKPGGYALVNSQKSPHELGLDKVVSSLPEGHFRTMPATEIAIEILGRPMPNAVMLGGLASLTGIVKLDSVSDAIRERFKGKVGNLNVEAAAAAYKYLKGEEEKTC
ncbi:2-oxoacid:acceptor oxidoreductase family protein [Mobiluncus mulieris]|uniref:2-oxoacid:acceptor oxidoreductase, gamma subunit, pyruvate/2-ketoisovalerate family n=2 Tax=Mobiluncus mulieris TaxID=2052 RepID=E0QN68_9ACTO|nr:2-oxoacid:acceptor oxidoreductase family protein [Mobiluncus mulieris]EEJ53068.1 2-oxoacid:acceptor oxidoreductase, gamma subunit, pyruvate/2-ketoisovalerate family [Mobiluncus mulieris ATCC 35243]EEZ90635.1 2-oxoacid:acceptor oxidoreductase, gamma subunit, pyruvate/2-ketoisovalerate family [Mobiluncus mulieris 28-1]EFM47020.1 2-oxoacid:acceptor oxidoreductase, gamma subunit, pyruvate/2-ketoisovalerate family [Mobiluncus mulieris ATCC 35239]EFN94056.1 2-oxoacid:acceptor oxidoreductase, gamma